MADEIDRIYQEQRTEKYVFSSITLPKELNKRIKLISKKLGHKDRKTTIIKALEHFLLLHQDQPLNDPK